MAAPYKRGTTWWIRYKDHNGQWQGKRTTARTKTEAARLSREVEGREERIRLGLERVPIKTRDSVGELAEWWLKEFSEPTASHQRNVSTVTRHIIESKLGAIGAGELTSGQIEAYLHSRSEELAPQTLNHVRQFLIRIYGKAIKHERVSGNNPALTVEKRKVPRRPPDYLRADEVPMLLEALSPKWRPLFATAIYTGMRKGELLGLRKSDIDWDTRQIMVARTYDQDTTKGKTTAPVPISSELVPYLQQALESSPSDLVFPREDGTMQRQDTKLEQVLRRAMGRAGIVQGYTLKCRRKGCGHEADSETYREASCPSCGMRLWAKAHVRKLRFHDLRHTTASLLMMAGANPGAVQRILRHSDPRITTEVYGHLSPDYLRGEIDRLRFGEVSAIEETTAAADAEPVEVQAQAVGAESLATYLLQKSDDGAGYQVDAVGNPLECRDVAAAPPARFELATFGLGSRCSIQLSYGSGRGETGIWGEVRQGRERPAERLICLLSVAKMRPMPGSLPLSLTYSFYGLIAWGLSALFVAFRILAHEKLKLGLALRIGLLAWLGVPAVLAFRGLFFQMGATPPYLMRVVAPMALLIFTFAFSRFGKWTAERLPLSFLVGLQGFRLPLEMLLYALATRELLPLEMTLGGYNFDIVTGVLALVLWVLIHKQLATPRIIWAFNILGTILLVTVVTLAVLSFPEPFGLFTPPTLLVAFYPWIWLPTFLVQLALLSHLLVYRKLLLPPPPPRPNI